MAIINLLMIRQLKSSDPNWVNPLADPWYENPLELWKPEGGFEKSTAERR